MIPLYLPDTALEAMGISPSEVADAIEAALEDKAAGRLHVSPKSAILPGGGRYMMSTLSVGEVTVVKQVTNSPGNADRGLPSINGAIMVLDPETGLLRALMGANWVTAVRTAALSAVAARRLADPASEVIAFVGTGVQARSHLDAFRGMFPLKRVLAYGRGSKNLDRLLSHATDMGLEAEAADSPEAALREADIVVTSVTLDYSIPAFLDARWLKPNAFAAITDLCIPWKQDSLGAFGTVVVDDLDQERASEKPMLDPGLIAGDLTDLVTGEVAGRAWDRAAAFAFRGIALGDYAAARLALERAEATGAGQRLG